MLKIGSIEHVAWESCVAHGNHNNSPLVDRVLLRVDEKLWELQGMLARELQRIAEGCRYA